MKLSILHLLVVLAVKQESDNLFVRANCEQSVLPFSDKYGIKLEKVGAVPAINTAPFSYNMNVYDNFNGDFIFFVDQNNGIIYSHEGGCTVGEVAKVWDMSVDSIPDGLTLDWAYASAPQIFRVKSMTQGPDNEIIVVFTSSTLPTGWTESDASLPAPGAVQRYACREDSLSLVEDIFRVSTVPECADLGAGAVTFTGYDSFYRFTMVSGKLTNPVPFFVSESHVSPGHLGGGVTTLPDGKILWSTGDCTVYGTDGSYAPQLDFESCGKILKIDPTEKGSYTVAAKGVRNSQQMRVFEQEEDGRRERVLRKSEQGKKSKKSPAKKMIVSFMDIGGVTAEEVNAFPVEALDLDEILNFGWGRNLMDGKAREGTFYVNHGKAFVLGAEPSCNSDAPLGEDGFHQPWVQFGRNGFDSFFGISSMAIPSEGSMLKLIWSEFNTGKLLGTYDAYREGAQPSEAFKLKIFDETGTEIDGLNPLVVEELGEDNVGFTSRGDPRLFHFPDGELGVLIERTGVFYKVNEIMLE
eukprot:CAMPEP_0194142260 /NCGR_PEP_ID=MMETSP0152-20130528/11575_1 /TAXON_ID=1049557 /ORGANISM="Thalassiothrix antarctica, Strain L6-D1" /LENGTH=523 /DNA_ID=CAMNT_0038841171 /DNA_START=287 /DNA_END=1858 /DNA_ORIENTATION=-